MSNDKDKGLTRTELRHRHSPWKLPRFLKVILDGIQKFISTDKKNFNVSNKVPSISSIDAFIIIPEENIFMHLTWRVRSLLQQLFLKFQVFGINRTENCSTIKGMLHILPWNFECLGRVIVHNFHKVCDGDCF